MNLNVKNEGLWDRLHSHGTGIKTAAKNLTGAVKSVATGTPINTTNVQQQKVKALYARFEKEVDKNLSTVKSNTKNVSNKIQSDINLKQSFLEFLKDLSKILGVSDANQAIGYIKKYPTTYPKIKSVLDSIVNSYNTSKIKLGSGNKTTSPATATVSSNNNKNNKRNKKPSSSSSSSSSNTTTNTPAASPIVNSPASSLPNVAPKSPAATATVPSGATIKSGTGNTLTYNGTVWTQSNGVPLNAAQSSLVSKKYLGQQQKSGNATNIPESKSVNNITYKEFFV